MERKVCRTCGKFSEDYVHVFRTEGLKGKIETCLPIVVSPHCLLPDTICSDCDASINNFYAFIKNCLQSIIILEAQFDVTESCLKTKRRRDVSTTAQMATSPQPAEPRETFEDYKEKILSFATQLAEAEKTLRNGDSFEKWRPLPVQAEVQRIVDYEDSSEDAERDFIHEITERKSRKRKAQSIMSSQPKIFKLDTNRRKRRPPVRRTVEAARPAGWNFDTLERFYDEMVVNNKTSSIGEEAVVEAEEEDDERDDAMEENVIDLPINKAVPQVCLLCDMQLTGPGQLATHVFETHGIDMAQVMSNDPVPEKRKKLPNLVKITDLKSKRDSQEKYVENGEEPPTLEPNYVCPLCPAMCTNKSDLFVHLRQKHPSKSHLICGLCLFMATSYLNLTDHLEVCSEKHAITHPYICKVCKYSEDNQKSLENHVLVHDFIINFCKKESKIFDPADYVEVNESCDPPKTYTCNECGNTYGGFKEFSAHRRSHHSIFHCDLCNKFYGRNSHLWKHVNRLHKGHPSITCQFCYKTSASKYHLAQHFNKIHTVKSSKPKNGDVSEEDFMTKKFDPFDFQSVRQSFMRQELADKKEPPPAPTDEDCASMEGSPPKEIDTSSNLYTNIITNYTPPPPSIGEFKCPKCSKGFHKKTLLKKHKKNCRPRLQKDLLTRCKSCSRIFKDRQSLAKHLVNYHSEYSCELCDEKVQSKCEIVSHIRFSHPQCHLFCGECENVLRNQDDHRTHTADHSATFVCQFCGDLLPSKIKLKMHILSLHRKILSLSCGICLKLFETQHILRDHVRLVHRDVLTPRTSCTVCGKNYGSKWKTYDHINKSHGRIFKTCKTCLEVFDTDGELERHCEAAHGNGPKEKVFVKKEMIPKKEVYESELDMDYKNSSSAEESSYELEEPSKMSLLEQRLTEPEPEPPVVTPKNKRFTKKPVKPTECDYTPDQNGANSSKRTVYVNSNDPSLCEICFKTWPAKKHLWQHYIRCHKAAAATVCGICLKTNDSYELLQKHLRSNHPNLLHGCGFGSNFICRICGRYHNASSKLRLHMVIHENFDWNLLGMTSAKQEVVQDAAINYESMIEQVECSSENESSSSSESDDETEASEAPIKEEEQFSEESSTSQSVTVKSENGSSDDDDEEEEEDDDDEDDVSLSNHSENTSENVIKGMNVYRHPDVVDSAVKSICYEVDECDGEYSSQDYGEVQSHSLNPHELQSAVDSIL